MEEIKGLIDPVLFVLIILLLANLHVWIEEKRNRE